MAFLSATTHFVKDRGIVSPLGRKTALPKSTTTPIRFFDAAGALVAPQIRAKLGASLGVAASGTLSLLKVNAQPSTEPFGTTTVGPVMAMVQVFAPGAA